MGNADLYEALLGLWNFVSPRRRRQLVLLTLLIVITSFSEILSIGAIVPFLGILMNPGHFFEILPFKSLFVRFGFTTLNDLILPFTLAFGFLVIFSAFMRMFLVWANLKLSFAIGAELSLDVYKRTLYQPYSVHISRNSSEVISAISSKTNAVIYNVISPVILLISSAVMMVAIIFTLFILSPLVMFFIFGLFGTLYFLLIYLTRNLLKRDGECMAYETSNVMKLLQEGLGGIRDILINGSQSVYCKIYAQSDLRLRKSQASSAFLALSPRYVMEAIGVITLISLAYFLTKDGESAATAIPLLGALAFGAQKLLPAMQQAYGAWAGILSSKKTLHDILEFLSQSLPRNREDSFSKLPFNEAIELKNISFRYGAEMSNVLEGVNLKIKKGSRLGFVGETGSGKSTLVDIIMGLLTPTEGVMLIDNVKINTLNNQSWRWNIAHVPQSIFLTDSTIESNIAFGVPQPEIDLVRVRNSAKLAQLDDTIQKWPLKYKTIVGERGVKLSGGQRQRIGIARALYKNADILVFDEATSALDNKTEKAVMNVINKLSEKLTILIISHRLSTLDECSSLIEINAGKINILR
jgi:ABC-type multidrug transport system fused ATPase/permease subunit